MWPNPQETANLVTFTEEIRDCAVIRLTLEANFDDHP